MLMDLDREKIVRKDFKRVVRGYDPWEVETHLREVNGAIRRMVDDLVRGEGDLPLPVQERLRTQSTIAELKAHEILSEGQSAGRCSNRGRG